MGKGYNNYMCKKPFHPGSKANIKRAWMAEQRTENEKKRQDELRVQYEKEQDLYNNKALLSKESKDKLALNFMYEAPPGAKRERQKEDDEPEYKFDWQRKYNAPREDFAKDNKDIKDQPFGIPVRNVRCIKCHQWGHINTDKECPLYNQAHSSSMPTTSMDPMELMKQMREDGLSLKQHILGHQVNPSELNQQILTSEEEDPEMEFLKTLSTKQKKKLLRKLNKLSKKEGKGEVSMKKKKKKERKLKKLKKLAIKKELEKKKKMKKSKMKSSKVSSSSDTCDTCNSSTTSDSDSDNPKHRHSASNIRSDNSCSGSDTMAKSSKEIKSDRIRNNKDDIQKHVAYREKERSHETIEFRKDNSYKHQDDLNYRERKPSREFIPSQNRYGDKRTDEVVYGDDRYSQSTDRRRSSPSRLHSRSPDYRREYPPHDTYHNNRRDAVKRRDYDEDRIDRRYEQKEYYNYRKNFNDNDRSYDKKNYSNNRRNEDYSYNRNYRNDSERYDHSPSRNYSHSRSNNRRYNERD